MHFCDLTNENALKMLHYHGIAYVMFAGRKNALSRALFTEIGYMGKRMFKTIMHFVCMEKTVISYLRTALELQCLLLI
jgi:arsenate reductase-like glutaredoxin family protein